MIVLRAIGAVLRPFFLSALLILGLFSGSRLLLVLRHTERVVDADMVNTVFLQGFRFDLVVVGFLLLWPILLLPFALTSAAARRIWQRHGTSYFVAAFCFVAFMEAATPAFIDQFDSRPNRLFLEYLIYPKEVFSTLASAYAWQLVAAGLVLAGSAFLGRRVIAPAMQASPRLSLLTTGLLTLSLIPVCGMMIRSTLDHRPVNPSTVALSDDPLVNDLALNSAYTVLYSLYEMRREDDGGFRYGAMADSVAIRFVQEAMGVPVDDFVDPDLPTMHRQQATAARSKPKNLVIILEESLGAEYVGSLGGLPLTPNLDALSRDGWWFRNMYATGTRSVRGLEALITGFTPTPARSVVKLGGSQRNFFTIADALRRKGYETSFIYGGESQFDNMRRFFMNNGFMESVDEDDFPDAQFHGSWGVSDEDLLQRAHREFSDPHDKPFFALVFTTSNHSPYDFPEDRIELYEEPQATVHNAVKYADHALGRFFEAARDSSYWDDTIFLVVADHNSRVFGADLVPIEHFHIPALILGGAIEPAVFEPVASQIDLPPTLLSLIGVSTTHPMIGHDLTRAEYRVADGRAIMQYNDTQAYMEGDAVVVLRRGLEPEQFRYDGRELMRASEPSQRLEQVALAHATWSSITYEKKLYRPAATDRCISATAITAMQSTD